jgi:hypothetical protein
VRVSTPSDDDQKSESDVGEDPKVASSRAGKEGEAGEDGTYVGRTSSDDAIDDEQTGAEARAQQNGS